MTNNTTLRTDKDLKSKNVRGKKVYILAKDIDTKRKFEIKAKTNRLENGLFFLDHPNSGSCVQNAYTLLQNIFLYTKY